MELMRIFISIQDGGELVAHVSTRTLIRELKQRIEKHIKVPPERQILLYRCRELQDEKSFISYPFIRERARLRLHIKPSAADLEEIDDDAGPSNMGNGFGNGVGNGHTGHTNGHHHGISDLETIAYLPMPEEEMETPNMDDLMEIVNRDMNTRRSKRRRQAPNKLQLR